MVRCSLCTTEVFRALTNSALSNENDQLFLGDFKIIGARLPNVVLVFSEYMCIYFYGMFNLIALKMCFTHKWGNSKRGLMAFGKRYVIIKNAGLKVRSQKNMKIEQCH